MNKRVFSKCIALPHDKDGNIKRRAFTMMTLDMCGGMKMILIDYNQISISNLMAELNKRPTDNIDFDLVRHMILNTIRGYRKKWHDEFGEVVIACDNRRYWRRQVFPNQG